MKTLLRNGRNMGEQNEKIKRANIVDKLKQMGKIKKSKPLFFNWK